MIYFLLSIDILLTAAAQLSLRRGAAHLGEISLSLAAISGLLKNYFLILGVALFTISFFLYVFVLSKLQLNVVYPVAAGMTLVVITVATHFFLKESFTAIQTVGIATVIVGITMILLPR